MLNVVVVVVVLLAVGSVSYMIRRKVDGLVPKRGIGVGSDLGVLGDTPRVRIREVVAAGPDRVRVVLTPVPPTSSPEMDFYVRLGADEFGLGVIKDWQRSESALAMVIPPDSRLVRLRSIDDLQHLTLRLF